MTTKICPCCGNRCSGIRLIPAEWWREQYVHLGKSAQTIADEIGSHKPNVQAELKRHGIAAHRPGYWNKGVPLTAETKQKISAARRAAQRRAQP